MHGTLSALLFRARQVRPALRCALGLSLLLGAAPAWTADNGDAAELLGKLRDGREACDAKLDALRAAQAAQPAALQPAFALADCLYENGRHQVARELLDPVWRGQSAAQAKAALGDRADEGIALYAILLAHGGRGAEASATLQAGEAALGPRPHLQRARLLGRAYGGDKAGAWRELDALLAAHPAELPYLMAAAELASIDPDGISAPARAVIGMRATPNSRYNRAARQFSDGAPRACADSVRQALPELPPAEAPRFLSLGYRCAVQAEDTAAAAAMLKQLGPTGAKALPADALLVHARLLVDAGEGATGVRLLGLVQRQATAWGERHQIALFDAPEVEPEALTDFFARCGSADAIMCRWEGEPTRLSAHGWRSAAAVVASAALLNIDDLASTTVGFPVNLGPGRAGHTDRRGQLGPSAPRQTAPEGLPLTTVRLHPRHDTATVESDVSLRRPAGAWTLPALRTAKAIHFVVRRATEPFVFRPVQGMELYALTSALTLALEPYQLSGVLVGPAGEGAPEIDGSVDRTAETPGFLIEITAQLRPWCHQVRMKVTLHQNQDPSVALSA
jgi:hypothetical protein